MSNKAKILFMDSEFTAELKNVDSKGGSAIVDKEYEHIIDKTNPLILKSGLASNTPLYICKWDSLVPTKFKKVTKVVSRDEAEKILKDDDRWLRIENPPEAKQSKKGRGWLRQKIINWKRGNKPTYQRANYQNMTVYEPTQFEYRKLEPVNPKFIKSDIPPSLMKETFDMRFLKNMKTYSAGKGGGEGIDKNKTIFIAIGSMIFGIVFMYLIFSVGL